MKHRKPKSQDHKHFPDGFQEDSRHFTGLDAKPGALLKAFIVRLMIFAVLWWGLSSGVMTQQLLIFFVITVSAALSSLLIPPQKISIFGIFKFSPFFIRLSILGGLDVASRAFKPSMPLKTGFISYNLNLTHPTARVIFVWVVSLFPGTAGVQLVDRYLRIHVLDQDLSHNQRLRELEQHVKALFRS